MLTTDPRRMMRLSHCGTALVLLASLWLPHANAVPDETVDATGKLVRSPVLGPRAPDGSMGGIIPSAVPGWTPHPSDAHDAYVFVRPDGWELGDTRAERSGPDAETGPRPATGRESCQPGVPCIR